MEKEKVVKNCILIVDDDYINRELLKNIFSPQYTFEEAADGEEGYMQIHKHIDKLCAIILDIQMPKMSGIEVLEKISNEGITENIPTFIITARDDIELITTAYDYGVMDVIIKPVIPVIIQKRVKSIIELFVTKQSLHDKINGQQIELNKNAKIIDELNKSTIEALATAIEFRDIESGEHVNRIYGITKYILSNTSFGDGYTSEDIENIARGSIMHDVGKIAISDVILNKPGKLNKEEVETMKLHTVKGAELLAQICTKQNHDSYRYGLDIARHHHERWDGKGYPDHLAGNDISVPAQVVSIADVYDALVSERVYKNAFTPDVAMDMISKGKCGVFNSELVKCFYEIEPEIRKWYASDNEIVIENSDNPENGEIENQAKSSGVNVYSSNAVNDIMLLMGAIQTAYDMIISVNLTKNTYYMMNYERFLTHCAKSTGKFDDLIEMGASSIPVSNRKEFKDTFCRASLLNQYAQGKSYVNLEHPQYSDDGKLHWVSTTVLFMEDSRSGDILEITFSKYIDDEYKERERTRNILADAINLAQHASDSKRDFLSKMSHDVRTPLNAIIGMTTIIATNLDDKEKISDCVLKIGTSSKYLLGIVNNALDYLKISNGGLALSMKDFNIRDLISDVMGEIEKNSKLKHQKFTVNIETEVEKSYIGDDYRIRQVLVSLLDNACKYTPQDGEYSLTVEAKRHSVEYDIVKFVVEDNGIGMTQELVEVIFDPFIQGNRDYDLENLGLGLPISQNLANLMNGTISVESEVGKGSVFTFELPLERGSLTAYSETINTDIDVLVVDDDLAICEQTSILLNNMGISTVCADNGYDAVNFVRERIGTDDEFDVAIIDWKMPEIDGIETVKRIRNIVGKEVLVVIMSAYDWSEIEEEARSAGADLFISKPVSESNLRTAIACTEKLRWENQEVSFNGEKVLVVEDNEVNAEIAKTILEMKNLDVVVAQNGKIAYDIFTSSEKGEYLAILMDLMMPEMDGYTASKAIRASFHAEAETIPIYAMTANTAQADVMSAKEAGMDGHISKPIDFEEVSRILQTIIKNKQRRKVNV